MDRKHYAVAIGIWLWSIVFTTPTLEDMQEASKIFRTGWQMFLNSAFVGIVAGIGLRYDRIRNLVVMGNSKGESLLQSGLGIVGLGFIGIGLIGAGIIYWRFNDIQLVRVPLQATVIGICPFLMHLVSNWTRGLLSIQANPAEPQNVRAIKSDRSAHR